MTATAGATTAVGLRALAAVLCLGIVYVHLLDQHFFAFAKSPGYVLGGYILVEIVGLITAVLLATRAGLEAWVLALGVAAGPFVGFVLSRGPGLPDYSDDKGNWSETLGIVSLILEAALFVVALRALRRQNAHAR
jgi:hypothetical protein